VNLPTSNETNAAIELVGVTKRYGALTALAGVDLPMRPGRTTVLIGPSGCGKSTLLRTIIGLIRPDAGTVSFEGVAVDGEHIASVRRRTGYVIQEGGLFPHLTAGGNVTLAAEHFGWSRGRCRARVLELAELVHLPAATLERYPAQLSGGQRQRVGLMRALMLDPHVLLLDEPLGALDPLVRARLQDELRAIFRQLRKTVVLVTHDLSEAAYLADTIVLLNQGRIVQAGTLPDLLERPADPFVSEFIRAQRRDLIPAGADK
jgi:osmoprotectant transport system ATP-binding protein